MAPNRLLAQRPVRRPPFFPLAQPLLYRRRMEAMTMKKLVLVGLMAVTTMANATSVRLPFLELSSGPIAPNYPYTEVQNVRVLDNGEVHGYRSGGVNTGWRRLATLPPYEMQRLRTLVARASRAPQLVAPITGPFNCAAMPMRRDVFRAPQYNLTLEEGTFPCGRTLYNDTRSALEIVTLLNSYRDLLH